METGYCLHCQEVSTAKREDIDICLAIILFLFTAGIGLIIYLGVYYSKPKNRCIHCSSILQPTTLSTTSLQNDTKKTSERKKNPFKKSSPQERTSETTEVVQGGTQKFCPYCGESVDSETKFCSNCGSQV
ncbi:MAG: zinc-ribbon domain-containing protein [Candidatus Lokiarchaeota archaeon]|nr:zinc-ribbon domain-containing protein [Candidatus Lokiarchaeota archaeon]MBD3200602.1 zinc-ribbon domain-containing protein [Candidatus Lokiarchaeota archaeon]